MAPDSVGSEELRDNTVADAEIDYNQVTLNDFLNDAGFITGAQIVSAAANNSIIDNGGAFFDDTPLQNDIAANTAAIANDGDSDSNNEIQNLALNGNTLSIANGNSVDLSGFNNSGSDDQNLLGANLSPANVLQIDIENGNSATVDLSSLSGTGTDDQNLLGATLSPANILTINIENGNPANVDLSSLSGTGTDDQTLGLAGNEISIENGNSIDLTPILGSGSTELADQITIVGDGSPGNEFEVNDGSINSNKITDGTVNTIDLANNSITTAKIQDANVTPIKIAPGNPGQFLNTDGGGNVVWADVPPSDDNQTAIEVPFTPTGNTLAADVQNAIEELQTEIDGISAGGAANPTDELQNLSLTGNLLSLTPPATPSTPVDLSFLIDDADPDPTNEFNTAITLNGTSLELTDSGGTLSQDLDGTFATDAELAAINTDDGDADPTNEYNTAIGLNGTSIEITDPGGTLSQDLNGTFATDAELGALSVDDADADAFNEIQSLSLVGNDLTLSLGGGTVTLPGGNDGVVSNITTSSTELVVTGANGGFNGSVDLENLVDTAAGNNGYLTAELDDDPTNEFQTLSLTGSDLTLSDGGGTVTLPGGAADGVVSNVAASGTELQFTGSNGGFNGNVDLENLVDAAANNNGYLTSEVDGSITNEIELPPGGINGQVLSTDGAGIYSWVNNAGGATIVSADANNSITAGTDGGAFYNDPDASAANELQTLSILGSDLTLSNGGGTVTLPGGSGEANTASNQGNGGVGVYIQKTGVDLEFKNINAGSNKVTITNDVANGEIDIDVDESNFAISGGLGGPIIDDSITASDLQNDSVDKGEIRVDAVGSSEIESGAVTTDEILNGTIEPEDINPGADGQILRVTGGAVAWYTPSTNPLKQSTGVINSIRTLSASSASINDSDYTIVLEQTVSQLRIPDPSPTNLGRVIIIKDLGGLITALNLNYINNTGRSSSVTANGGILWLQSDGTNWHQIN